MKQMKWTGLVLAAMMVFLAACGGGNNAGNDKQESGQASSNANANANASTNTAVDETAERTIKHALGETKMTGTPKKVVVLEWTYAEDLIALGVQPAGVADVKGYGEWYEPLIQSWMQRLLMWVHAKSQASRRLPAWIQT